MGHWGRHLEHRPSQHPLLGSQCSAHVLLKLGSRLCSPRMEEVSYSTSCPDSVNEALLCLLAAPKLHTLELTPRNMTLAPEHMHVLGAPNSITFKAVMCLRRLCRF